MKRFIYSGCSFTNFAYPTWGDIIAYDLIKYKGFDLAINLGKGGACNNYIAHQLLMARSKLNITSKDLIGVCWSTPDRFSYIAEVKCDFPASGWYTNGSVANHGDGPFGKNNHQHLLTINSAHSCLMRTLDAYNSTNAIFNLEYQSMLSNRKNLQDMDLYDYLRELPMIEKTHTDYMTDSWEKFKRLPIFEVQSEFWDNGVMNQICSHHPDIITHLKHAQSITDLHNDTINLFTDLQHKFQSAFLKLYNDAFHNNTLTDTIKGEFNNKAKDIKLYNIVWDHEPFYNVRFSTYNPTIPVSLEQNIFDNL